MLDSRLITRINRGRCFALIGAGPSCELGYPSWHKLAEDTYTELRDKHVASDHASYTKYLKQKNYLALFELAEKDAGGRDNLISILKKYLKPKPGTSGHIYDILVRWPFACYLTTNYDNEIPNRLERLGEYYTTTIRSTISRKFGRALKT